MLTLGYLSYINDSNKHLRVDDFQKSIFSLKNITSKSVEIISIDNNSCDFAKKMLSSDIFAKKYHYDINFIDPSLFYTTMWHAEIKNHPYIGFMYDDFIVYDDSFDECITFLENNPDVHCVRITSYDFNNQNKFNCDVTPKSVNPDSIRHYNVVSNEKLSWDGPISVGNKKFYKNNWHYTSRPTIWRRSYFENIINKQGDYSNVLQEFESWATKEFFNHNLKTGVLDIGMMYTTSIYKSARTFDTSTNKLMIDVNKLRNKFEQIY